MSLKETNRRQRQTRLQIRHKITTKTSETENDCKKMGPLSNNVLVSWTVQDFRPIF